MDMAQSSTIQQILAGNCSTLVVQEHLAQIGLFMFRKGIEVLLTDPEPELSQLLLNWWTFNRIDTYFNDIWNRGAKTGEILFFIKPLPDGLFKVRYYDKSQFEYEQDDYGLTEVRIKGLGHETKKKEFVITRSKIGDRSHGYGFVPCVIVQNRPSQSGRGLSEFDGFEANIERHDWLVDQVRGNLEYFGGPIFYSSRTSSELVESGSVARTSISSQAGYGSVETSTTRVRAKRVIGGVEPGEQIGFATPDPITPETMKWVDKYEAQLRRSMGSVPSDKTFGFTDLDVVSYFAQAITTAGIRAEQYITQGLVRCFVMMFEMGGYGAVDLRWRYKGSLFPDTAQIQLTKSIVARNLLRMGVSLPDALQHVFPDKSEDEILADLEGGFAYELLNGVANVIKAMPEFSPVIDPLQSYLMENINGDRVDNFTPTQPGSVLDESDA